MTRAKRRPSRPPIEPIEGISPTPERIAKGGMVYGPIGMVEGAGRATRKAWRDTGATAMQEAARDGKLSSAQLAASQAYERLCHAAIEIRGGSRDSLDMTPRGQAEQTEPQAERIVRAKRALLSADMCLSPYQVTVIRGVLLWGDTTGNRQRERIRWRAIDDGLALLAAHFGYGK